MIERLARPLAGFWNGVASVVNGFYRVLGGPGKLLQDFANGTWLGHALHAVIVDVVVGAATAALLLDVLRVLFGVQGLADATTWVVGLALISAVGALLTGLTDFKDTLTGNQRNITGLHGLVNLVGTAGLALSLGLRLNGDHDLAFWALLVGYLVLSVGAYIGGHVVYKYGYMVNRNAYAQGKRAREWTPVMPATDLFDNVPTKASLGATTLVVVRRGDVVHALKETCPHVGGPLAEGRLEGDTIVCPWHFSAFRLSDGAVRHGPAATRQVAYRARINAEQVEVQGPIE